MPPPRRRRGRRLLCIGGLAALGLVDSLAFDRVACLGDSVTRGNAIHEEAEAKESRADRGNYPLTLGEISGMTVGEPPARSFDVARARVASHASSP